MAMFLSCLVLVLVEGIVNAGRFGNIVTYQPRTKTYPRYDDLPSIPKNIHAKMTTNSFAKGGDGRGPSECDEKYYSDNEMVVALSTRWYNGGSRCLQNILINANGRSVLAKVVDEFDSVNGCYVEHQTLCRKNMVVASPVVWKALGIPELGVGEFDITWSDA